jgi:adenylate cyclase
MNKAKRLVKEYSTFAFGFIIIFCFLVFLTTSPRGKHITQQFFDPIRTTDIREDIIIVGVDDKSLQSIGAWPWDRGVFAKLTKRLSDSGARAVVYDVLFLEPRSGDEEFKNVLLTTRSPVVLASKLENEKYLTSYLSSTANPNVYSALANVTPDTDGKVREYPTPYLDIEDCVFGLARHTFNLITFKKDLSCTNDQDIFFRYPKQVTQYSIVDVLSGNITVNQLKNKIVFIGSTSLDLEDHFVGMSGEKVPGVYVHAGILTSLLNNVGDRELTSKEILIFILVYVFLTAICIYRSRTILTQVLSAIILTASVLLISLLAYSYKIIIPAPWLVATIFLIGGYITIFRFIKERKKSEYIESMFSKYVHKDVLKELMKHSSDIHFEGEKREMSILFSDLRGFTTLSESMTPEELTKTLNAYLSAMMPSILNEKGTVDKFIGDAIMAFWNAPLYVENHTTHAVRAALHMQKALTTFNKKHHTALAMGVGVHVGNVIVGNVGSEERVNYTILGDSVNLASRIEGLTKKYGILTIVTEEVKEKVNDHSIVFRKLDVITVKGKNVPTVLYEIQQKDDANIEMYKNYEHAFDLYQKGDFDVAEGIFKELASQGDAPSEVMYERISQVKHQSNWDSVWHFDEK